MSPSNDVSRNHRMDYMNGGSLRSAGFIKARQFADRNNIRWPFLRHAIELNKLPAIRTKEFGDSDALIWWIHPEVAEVIKKIPEKRLRTKGAIALIDPVRPGMILRVSTQPQFNKVAELYGHPSQWPVVIFHKSRFEE